MSDDLPPFDTLDVQAAVSFSWKAPAVLVGDIQVRRGASLEVLKQKVRENLRIYVRVQKWLNLEGDLAFQIVAITSKLEPLTVAQAWYHKDDHQTAFHVIDVFKEDRKVEIQQAGKNWAKLISLEEFAENYFRVEEQQITL